MWDALLPDRWTMLLPGVIALAFLIAGTALAGLAWMNKGAKINLGWYLASVGLLVLGAAEVCRLLEMLRLADTSEWRDLIRLAGALLIFSGIVYARKLFTYLAK